MRTITFTEFAQIVDDCYAVVLDHNAVTYPYVAQEEDDDGNLVYDRIEVNYADEYEQIDNAFYSDDCDNITIEDNGCITFDANDEKYTIQLLVLKKIV